MQYDMEELLEQANEVQESLSRSYAVPEEIDEADLEAGAHFLVARVFDFSSRVERRVGCAWDGGGRGRRVVPCRSQQGQPQQRPSRLPCSRKNPLCYHIICISIPNKHISPMNNVSNVYSRSLPCTYFVLGELSMLIVTGERGAE